MNDHGWILSVFDDLYEYALANNLPVTAADILRKKKVARWEIIEASRSRSAPNKSQGNLQNVVRFPIGSSCDEIEP